MNLSGLCQWNKFEQPSRKYVDSFVFDCYFVRPKIKISKTMNEFGKIESESDLRETVPVGWGEIIGGEESPEIPEIN